MCDLVVEVRGGVVVEVYSRTPEKHVAIIDWDDIKAGDASRGVITRQCVSYAVMPNETRHTAESFGCLDGERIA